MRIGIYLPLKSNWAEQKKFIDQLPTTVDDVWISDNPIGTNAFLLTSRLLVYNKRHKFRVITFLRNYHPVVLASVSYMLFNEYSDNFDFVLGLGDPINRLKNNIKIDRPISEMTATIQKIYSKWKEFDSSNHKSMLLRESIGLATNSPEIVRQVVSEDKIKLILVNGCHLADIRSIKSILGSKIDRIKIYSSVILNITPNENYYDKRMASLLVSMVKKAPKKQLLSYGYDEKTITRIRQLPLNPKEIDPVIHQLITDLTISGDSTYCLDKIKILEREGIYGLAIQTMTGWDSLLPVINEI